jgi:TRAP transporter T-component
MIIMIIKYKLPALILSILLLNACSMAKMTVRMSMPMIDGGFTALYKETDLELAKGAFPPNISLMEGMLINDPDNEPLLEYAVQAYYGYAFSFVEDDDRERASKFYMRGFRHGKHLLNLSGFDYNNYNTTLDKLQEAVNEMDEDTVGALFWTASCWLKWIDMNRDSATSIAQLPKAVMLMTRAHELNEHFFMDGPNLFFAVYYGSRSPLLGGDLKLSERYFDAARKANKGKLLLVDLFQAQYLERQRFDRQAFHKYLNHIINAPDDIKPDIALLNTVAKHKARRLLKMEEKWF